MLHAWSVSVTQLLSVCSVAFLDKQLPAGLPDINQQDKWLPLMTYRSSLVQGEGEASMRPPPRSRARPRGKKAQQQHAADATGEWLSTDTSRDGPPLTSTAVKPRRGGAAAAAGAGDVTADGEGDADEA